MKFEYLCLNGFIFEYLDLIENYYLASRIELSWSQALAFEITMDRSVMIGILLRNSPHLNLLDLSFYFVLRLYLTTQSGHQNISLIHVLPICSSELEVNKSFRTINNISLYDVKLYLEAILDKGIAPCSHLSWVD